jgi:hypothetical protein
MLSLSQIAELRQYMAELTDRISNTIRTKPVKRKSKGLGSFEAPVNASGALADSIDFEIGEGEIKILANSYIDKLITGQPPGDFPPIFEIDNWLGRKGLPYSSFAVSNNIGKYGNSIFQEWQGAESNLLEDYVLNGEIRTEIVQNLIDRVQEYSIEAMTDKILEQFKKAA